MGKNEMQECILLLIEMQKELMCIIGENIESPEIRKQVTDLVNSYMLNKFIKIKCSDLEEDN